MPIIVLHLIQSSIKLY